MSSLPHIRRMAWQRLLRHAGEIARTSGLEAIGWLLGFFAGGEPYVLDSIAATRYQQQGRYGAVADPQEEGEIASAYPRNVGIVGIYHSHPFRNETRHAIFHSATDDATLKTRAARRENYLSVVTDGQSAECFVLRRGEPVEVQPEIREDLSITGPLERFTATIAPTFSLLLRKTSASEVVAALERKVSEDLDRAIASASVQRGTVTLPGLDAKAGRNRLLIEPSGDRHRADLSLRLEPAVYVARGDEAEALRAIRNEILDDIVFLLWRGFDASAVDLAGVERFEANLGSLRIHASNPLPKKIYRAPERATILRRRP